MLDAYLQDALMTSSTCGACIHLCASHLPFASWANCAACVGAIQCVSQLHDAGAVTELALKRFLTAAFCADFGLMILHAT